MRKRRPIGVAGIEKSRAGSGRLGRGGGGRKGTCELVSARRRCENILGRGTRPDHRSRTNDGAQWAVACWWVDVVFGSKKTMAANIIEEVEGKTLSRRTLTRIV